MPFGMEAEAAKLTGYAAKHEERVAWVRAHTGRLEREIGRPAYADAWVILGALVVDQPLVGAHLIAGELPIWTIDELGARLA
jgi:hypothetical protein